MKGTKKEDYPKVIGYTPQKIVFRFESGAEVRQYPKPHLLELVDEPA